MFPWWYQNFDILSIQNIFGQINRKSHIWISRAGYIFVEPLRNWNILTVEQSQ